MESDVHPLSLAPKGEASHEVSLENKDSVTYKLVISGQCGPLLRYGKGGTWGPNERTLKPGQGAPLATTIGLPDSCDKSQLPCWEQVVVKADVEPLDPMILGQSDSIFHDVHLEG